MSFTALKPSAARPDQLRQDLLDLLGEEADFAIRAEPEVGKRLGAPREVHRPERRHGTRLLFDPTALGAIDAFTRLLVDVRSIFQPGV